MNKVPEELKKKDGFSRYFIKIWEKRGRPTDFECLRESALENWNCLSAVEQKRHELETEDVAETPVQMSLEKIIAKLNGSGG